jgi:hypothetical protein
MMQTASEAATLLNHARSAYWKAEEEAEKTSKMVRPNGDLFES